MPRYFNAKNAEATLFVEEGDPLNRAGEFLGRSGASLWGSDIHLDWIILTDADYAEFLFRLYCYPMCGRFRLTRASKLAERFGIEPEDEWVPSYNIAPTQNVEVIRQRAEEPNRFGSKMRWGSASA
jgi:hypothetical protein